MSLPYHKAVSGQNVSKEIQKILQKFGAKSFGLMEDFDKGEVIAQFNYRDRNVSINASSKGYAAAWIKENPYTYQMKCTRQDYEKKALKKGQMAVFSILRDWIKGQITAVECGMLSFEAAFLGQIMLPTGRTVLEEITEQKILKIENKKPPF